MHDDLRIALVKLDIRQPAGLKLRWVLEFGVYEIMGWQPNSEAERAINGWNNTLPPGDVLRIGKKSMIVSIGHGRSGARFVGECGKPASELQSVRQSGQLARRLQSP